jgi:hypothetical protein
MKVDALIATVPVGPRMHLSSAYACMPKKMRYWKQVERESEKALCYIVIRGC